MLLMAKVPHDQGGRGLLSCTAILRIRRIGGSGGGGGGGGGGGLTPWQYRMLQELCGAVIWRSIYWADVSRRGSNIVQKSWERQTHQDTS